MRPRRPKPAAIAAAASAAVLLAVGALSGCAAGAWEHPHAAPSLVGALGDGFAPDASPSPEATVAPAAGSWDDVHPSPGYRVVLLTAGDDEPTRTLASAVTDWAGAEGVDLRRVDSGSGDDPVDAIVEAMELNPDLIVSVGDPLVDPLAIVTANHLDEHFLVLGAEVAEPTANVTSVDWTGAAYRGEGLGTASHYDAETFTAERGGRAIRAGTAAVLSGMTGVVLWID